MLGSFLLVGALARARRLLAEPVCKDTVSPRGSDLYGISVWASSTRPAWTESEGLVAQLLSRLPIGAQQVVWVVSLASQEGPRALGVRYGKIKA